MQPVPQEIHSWQELTSQDFQTSLIGACRANMSLLRRCKVILKKDDKRWESLIGLLKEYIENLRTYGPELDVVRLEKSQFDFLVGLSSERLRAAAEATREEAQSGGRDPIYDDMAIAATFGANVQEGTQPQNLREFNITRFRIMDNYTLPSSPTSTMALISDYPVTGVRCIVLIEWLPTDTHYRWQDARATASLLYLRKPRQMLIPECYGIVEDRGRLGLIFASPKHIGLNVPPQLQPGSISQKRMPLSLEELLMRTRSRWKPIDLGHRFRLAQKLVDAAHMMHCVGWVHKYGKSFVFT